MPRDSEREDKKAKANQTKSIPLDSYKKMELASFAWNSMEWNTGQLLKPDELTHDKTEAKKENKIIFHLHQVG